MEHEPSPTSAGASSETFGIEPSAYEREIPEAIRTLAPALHRFEREAGSDEDVREGFAGVYPEKKIETDLAEVERLERVFATDDDFTAKKNRLYAKVLELIVQDLAHEWFPDCAIWPATKFDDYKRQTDLFMAIAGPEEGSWLTLALDVTSSAEAARGKLQQSLEEFDRGRFHDVEYFTSEVDPTQPRGRAFMPRMIVGSSLHTIASLARLYGTWRRGGGRETKAGLLERLRFHALGSQLYEEIIRQAEVGHSMMRRELKSTPTFQVARRETIKAQAAYLKQVGQALQERLDRLRHDADLYEQKNGSFGERQAPVNAVFETILEAA